MSRSTVTKVWFVLAALFLLAAPAFGATPYPSKAITFVAPSGAGGAFDMALRFTTKVLAETKIVDQQMLVEAKPGGGGSVFIMEYVVKDKKNDYKLFLTSPTMLINNLKREGNCPYTYKHVTPLAQFFVDYAVIAVPAKSKYNDLKTLFNDMKADPTKLSVAGGSGPGALDHLTFMLPAFKYGIDPKKIKYISYDGKAEAMASLLGGNADVLTSVSASVGEYLKAGKIKVLAINAPERQGGAFKDVPTLKELGIQAEFGIWRGIFGAPEMSAEAKKYWIDAFTKLAKSDAWKKELERQNLDADFRSGDAFKKTLDDQDREISALLKSLGMAK
ncbi:MAG: tripartite tricarboxylate transporter substrate binding protein [Deltaproteobacteria bacterium]|nr:tripartite tricarboxylate transporter substrate binding protein [Deltaproteobacteria bacterium]